MKKNIIKIISFALVLVFVFGLVCTYDYINLKQTKLITKYKRYEITGVYPYSIKDENRHDQDSYYGLTFEQSEYLAKNRQNFKEVALFFEMKLYSNFDLNLIVKSELSKLFKSKNPYVYCYNYILDEGNIKYASIMLKKKTVRINMIIKNEYLNNFDDFLNSINFNLKCVLKRNIVKVNLNQELVLSDKYNTAK